MYGHPAAYAFSLSFNSINLFDFFKRPSQQVGEMSDSRRCSSADSENMREKNYKNLFAAGRSVKNVPRH